MRYFVTGATGFLGSRLVGRLVDGGNEVVALVRTPSKADALPSGVEATEGDVTDRESMRDGMDGADGVFHLAAWYRVGPAAAGVAERVNVDGTRNVLELVDELDVPKAVYTSTLAVNSDTGGELVDESYRFEGEHLSVYDRTKHEAHHGVAAPMMADGLPLVVAMPGVIYGPGDTSDVRNLWTEYLNGGLLVVPRRTAYCWGHVEDTARAHVAAMERGEPGEEYIVAGEPYTLVEAFAVAERITGVDAPRAVSPAWFRWLSRVAGLAGRVVDLPPTYSAEALRVLGGATYFGDNSKAERELGLEHRPFEDGLREYLEWEADQQGIELPA